MKIRLGSRGSKLALAQTKSVMECLKKAYPEHHYEIQIIHTKGDKILEKPLDKIGDKGVFVKEIEEKLLEGEIDLGVHSMKDMPASLAEGLIFSKTWKREDVRDVLILKKAESLEELPSHSVIATGSKRRIYQLRQIRPDLCFVGIRGNIDTRLKKLEEEEIDGIILAAAGLHRLGLQNKITQYLEPEEFVPAPAQGALALEIRRDRTELKQMLDALSDEADDTKTRAERIFLSEIGGNCHIPIGAVCLQEKGQLKLIAVLGEEERENLYRVEVSGTNPEELGKQAAEEILYQISHGNK